MPTSFGFSREGDRVISVGGREPASVEEAVEGIRLGGRSVHLLVRFCLCLGLCLCPCLCLCLCLSPEKSVLEQRPSLPDELQSLDGSEKSFIHLVYTGQKLCVLTGRRSNNIKQDSIAMLVTAQTFYTWVR